jgi:hypothetical protein
MDFQPMIDLLDNLRRDLLLAEVDDLTDDAQVGCPSPDENWPVIIVQGCGRVGPKKPRERGGTPDFQALLNILVPPGFRKYVDLKPTMTRSQQEFLGRNLSRTDPTTGGQGRGSRLNARIVDVPHTPESVWPKDAVGRSTEPGESPKRRGG